MPKPSAQIYVCAHCDAQTTKWSGRCLECGAWGALKEEAGTETRTEKAPNTKPGALHSFAEETTVHAATSTSGVTTLDHILGGGLVQGSVTLLAGEPGIGKSTLLAQAALALGVLEQRVVYVTGEESPAQIQRRLKRLAPIVPPSVFFLDDTNAATVAATIDAERPALVIVDSIQTMRTEAANGEAGSVAQVKACAAIITEAAKHSHVPVILVGQVTKDGDVAGPRVLEHLVVAIFHDLRPEN